MIILIADENKPPKNNLLCRKKKKMFKHIKLLNFFFTINIGIGKKFSLISKNLFCIRKHTIVKIKCIQNKKKIFHALIN